MVQQILTPDQITLLQAIGNNDVLSKQFYLSGGTALAGFYLHHRYSEDLDFFSENEVDVLSIQTFFHGLKKKLNIQMIDFQQSFNRNLLFLHLPNGVLKTEFTYFPFPPIELGSVQYGLRIDSLLDIAVNKLLVRLIQKLGNSFIYKKPNNYIQMFYGRHIYISRGGIASKYGCSDQRE